MSADTDATDEENGGGEGGGEIVEDQSAVFDLLGDQQSYDPVPGDVGRIDTHGAVVFLAGDDAYKMKRAVRFPFMDFSTLDKRHAALARELEVNRLTAPDIYLGLVPVTRGRDDVLRLGGDGEPVEWTVRMARFEQSAVLDEMARAGKLTPGLMADLADHIVHFHGLAPVARDVAGAAILKGVLDQTVEAFAGFAKSIGGNDLATYRDGGRKQLERVSALLDRRAEAGHVRRCHGDMHLKNIVLTSDGPVLFDAIEFDEAIATIDVLYDLAFLLMDLWQRGLPDCANALMNRYLAKSGEDAHLEGLAALPLMLAVRAGVRAMISLLQAGQAKGGERDKLEAAATSYFAHALSFLAPDAPGLIAIGGFSGTGKTTLAQALCPHAAPPPGALLLRSDVERKTLFGVGETTRLGADAYTKDASDKVYGLMMARAGACLAAGHSVVFDAVCAGEDERAALENLAADKGAGFHGLWLEAPEETLKSRVGARTGDASDATAEVVERQLRHDPGEIGWTRIDAAQSRKAVLKEALATLPPAQAMIAASQSPMK